MTRDEDNAETADKMRTRLEALEGENAKLRRDNERFVRLIDSGDWTRQRVDEMQKAGEVCGGGSQRGSSHSRRG